MVLIEEDFMCHRGQWKLGELPPPKHHLGNCLLAISVLAYSHAYTVKNASLLHSGAFDVDAQAAANASVTVTATAVAGAGAGAASAPVNTFFRPQDQIMTSDASPEDQVPGLEATDYKKTWRTMPNVEHFSPFITMFEPLFPTMMKFTTAMGINFPMEWPLAGSSGKHESWMKHTLLVYTRAMMGMGPKPSIAPTILVPTHQVRDTTALLLLIFHPNCDSRVEAHPSYFSLLMGYSGSDIYTDALLHPSSRQHTPTTCAGLQEACSRHQAVRRPARYCLCP